MVDFLPFRGLVPKLKAKESVLDRVSPPYDVIGPEELKQLQARPHNIARLTLGGKDSDYAEAAAMLRQWISDGDLAKDHEDCYYLIKQKFMSQGKMVVRTGLMGALRLEPYETGNIAPHEETFPKVKEDRLNLLRATEAHLESIFCLYDRLDEPLMGRMDRGAQMLFHLTDRDGTEHAFGRISDPDLVKELRKALADKRLLIADGHHRYETALRYSQEHPQAKAKGFVLATLVAGNDPGLAIMPTHRIVKKVQISTDEFLFHAAKFFAIWEARSQEEMVKLVNHNSRTSLGVLLPSGQRFVMELAWRPTEDPLWSVDAYVCEELLFNKILRKKGEMVVDYDHDLDSVAGRLGEEGVTMAIVLSPPKLDLVWKVAKEGEKMPRKSTYFYPKIWSGFVAYDMK